MRIPCCGDGFSTRKCDLCYIGQTGNKLGDNIGQHCNDLKKSNKSESKNGQTALVRNFQEGHGPEFEYASISLMEPNEFKRRVLESLNVLTNVSMNFTVFLILNIFKVRNSILCFPALQSGSRQIKFFDKVFF